MVGSSVAAPPQICNSFAIPLPQSPPMVPISRMVSAPAEFLPAEPPPLKTPHMVDPESVEKQRQAFAVAISSNYEKASQEIAKQVQVEKQELAQKAALEKANYEVMVDQFVQQQALAMDQQTNIEIMRLQQAAVADKSVLEREAVGLKMAYEERKTEEDMMLRQYELERQFREQTATLTAEAEKVQTTMAAHGMLPAKSLAEPSMQRDWWKE